MAKTDSTEGKESQNIENGDIANLLGGLTEIGNLEIEDFDVNWKVARNLNTIKVLHKAYLKSSNAISKKYMKIDEKGQFALENNANVFLSAKSAEDFNVEMEKLNAQPVQEVLLKLKASDLKKLKGIKGIHMAMCSTIIIDDIK